MKKITAFVLAVMLVLGMSTYSFAVDGNELVTAAEKAQALKDKKVKEVIETAKVMHRKAAKKVVKFVAEAAVSAYVGSKLKGVSKVIKSVVKKK